MKTIYILKKSFKGNTEDLMAYVDKDEATIEMLRLKEENPTIEYWISLLALEENLMDSQGFSVGNEELEKTVYLETGDENTFNTHNVDFDYTSGEVAVFEGGLPTGETYTDYELTDISLYGREIYPINKARLSDQLVERIKHECNNVIENL